jgi:hypothetical protein
LWRNIHQLGLPLIKPIQLTEHAANTYVDAANKVWTSANALKLHSHRGRINRQHFADLLFFNDVPSRNVSETIDWNKLIRVMVAGDIVWENGKRTGALPGVLLRRG